MKLKQLLNTGSLFLLAGSLLLSGISAQAAIYKWQDENGSWHFSEIPPDSQKAEKIDVRVTPPSGDTKAPPNNASTTEDTPDESGKPLPLSPEVAAAEKERKAKNCQIANKNLQSLTTRARVRFQDKEKGEERYLTEDERQKWIKDSKEAVKENCE